MLYLSNYTLLPFFFSPFPFPFSFSFLPTRPFLDVRF